MLWVLWVISVISVTSSTCSESGMTADPEQVAAELRRSLRALRSQDYQEDARQLGAALESRLGVALARDLALCVERTVVAPAIGALVSLIRERCDTIAHIEARERLEREPEATKRGQQPSAEEVTERQRAYLRAVDVGLLVDDLRTALADAQPASAYLQLTTTLASGLPNPVLLTRYSLPTPQLEGLLSASHHALADLKAHIQAHGNALAEYVRSVKALKSRAGNRKGVSTVLGIVGGLAGGRAGAMGARLAGSWFFGQQADRELREARDHTGVSLGRLSSAWCRTMTLALRPRYQYVLLSVVGGAVMRLADDLEVLGLRVACLESQTGQLQVELSGERAEAIQDLEADVARRADAFTSAGEHARAAGLAEAYAGYLLAVPARTRVPSRLGAPTSLAWSLMRRFEALAARGDEAWGGGSDTDAAAWYSRALTGAARLGSALPARAPELLWRAASARLRENAQADAVAWTLSTLEQCGAVGDKCSEHMVCLVVVRDFLGDYLCHNLPGYVVPRWPAYSQVADPATSPSNRRRAASDLCERMRPHSVAGCLLLAWQAKVKRQALLRRATHWLLGLALVAAVLWNGHRHYADAQADAEAAAAAIEQCRLLNHAFASYPSMDGLTELDAASCELGPGAGQALATLGAERVDAASYRRVLAGVGANDRRAALDYAMRAYAEGHPIQAHEVVAAEVASLPAHERAGLYVRSLARLRDVPEPSPAVVRSLIHGAWCLGAASHGPVADELRRYTSADDTVGNRRSATLLLVLAGLLEHDAGIRVLLDTLGTRTGDRPPPVLEALAGEGLESALGSVLRRHHSSLVAAVLDGGSTIEARQAWAETAAISSPDGFRGPSHHWLLSIEAPAVFAALLQAGALTASTVNKRALVRHARRLGGPASRAVEAKEIRSVFEVSRRCKADSRCAERVLAKKSTALIARERAAWLLMRHGGPGVSGALLSAYAGTDAPLLRRLLLAGMEAHTPEADLLRVLPPIEATQVGSPAWARRLRFEARSWQCPPSEE